MTFDIATVGGGCFWCMEAVFQIVRGVISVEPGYSGGLTKNPTYRQVCTGETGHAEVVRITFDSATLSYTELLEIFFSMHDPTTLNRQGKDVGTQYRSVIFTHTEEQQQVARKLIEELNLKHFTEQPIVTVIEPVREFYVAEPHHHRYFELNQEQPYCQLVISPKLLKLKEYFISHVKDK